MQSSNKKSPAYILQIINRLQMVTMLWYIHATVHATECDSTMYLVSIVYSYIEDAHFSFLAEVSFASEAHCGCIVK